MKDQVVVDRQRNNEDKLRPVMTNSDIIDGNDVKSGCKTKEPSICVESSEE